MAVVQPRSVVGLSRWMDEFKPKSVNVEYAVDRVTMGQVSSEYFCFLL